MIFFWSWSVKTRIAFVPEEMDIRAFPECDCRVITLCYACMNYAILIWIKYCDIECLVYAEWSHVLCMNIMLRTKPLNIIYYIHRTNEVTFILHCVLYRTIPLDHILVHQGFSACRVIPGAVYEHNVMH